MSKHCKHFNVPEQWKGQKSSLKSNTDTFNTFTDFEFAIRVKDSFGKNIPGKMKLK